MVVLVVHHLAAVVLQRPPQSGPQNAALFSSAVFFAGVVGDTSGAMISDGILRRTGDPQAARICLGLVFTTADLTSDAIFLAAGFFCLELVIGPIWSIPMDIAPQYAGTGSGLMNTGSAVAAIVSPLAFGLIVDVSGSWVLPFAVSIALLLLGCGMAFTMHPERRFAEAMSGKAA
jgi:hypothetical protein